MEHKQIKKLELVLKEKLTNKDFLENLKSLDINKYGSIINNQLEGINNKILLNFKNEISIKNLDYMIKRIIKKIEEIFGNYDLKDLKIKLKEKILNKDFLSKFIKLNSDDQRRLLNETIVEISSKEINKLLTNNPNNEINNVLTNITKK